MSQRRIPELRVSTADATLADERRRLLEHIADYAVSSNVVLKPEETLAFGYWIVKFRTGSSGDLEIWEYNAGATQYVRGAQLTLTYWRQQHAVCERFEAAFTPPRPDQLVVLSDGVMEGRAVQAVRYVSPHHMSGWWITTDLYDGNIQSLRREHMYHLTAARPDLAPYVALPEGYRMDFAHGEDVWFDSTVAAQSAE